MSVNEQEDNKVLQSSCKSRRAVFNLADERAKPAGMARRGNHRVQAGMPVLYQRGMGPTLRR